jgi:hypothetical protein
VPLLLVGMLVGAAIGTWASNARQATENGNGWEWGEINDAGRTVKGAVAGGAAGVAVGGLAAAGLSGSFAASTTAAYTGAGELGTTIATAGLGAGANQVANNVSQATQNVTQTVQVIGTKISQSIKPKHIKFPQNPRNINTPPNDGAPFNLLGSGQIGVDPNTLIINYNALHQDKFYNALQNVVRNGGIYGEIIVNRYGEIIDGNHRALIAQMLGYSVDIIVQ